MNVTTHKRVIDRMSRCYAVSNLQTSAGVKQIVASEGVNGAARLYAEDKQAETIWDAIGGTMSIVSLSDLGNIEESFLISQLYYPGFAAKSSRIVKVKKQADQWQQEEVMVLPYLHRFELIHVENTCYIVCSTLCTWKVEREDWSSPGHVFMGRYNQATNQVTDFRLVIPNLTKNHGMSKIVRGEQERLLISAEDGIFEVYVDAGEYKYEKKYVIASSETIYLDINNDGVDEVITIEPFHGDKLGIYQQDGQLIRHVKRNTQFLHALWGGKMFDKHILICGGRRGDSDLVVFYMNKGGELEEVIIDTGNGSANITVEQNGTNLTILSANNSSDEIAEYLLEFTE